MSGYIGIIGEFSASEEDAVSYMERFDMFLAANAITDENRKRAIFLSSVGGKGYQLLRSLAGNKPMEKSYKDLKALLIGHLNPKPNIIAERYKFYKRERRNDESVSGYLAELIKLSEHCGFGANIDEFVRDKFVCGIANDGILRKLLAEKDLTLDKAKSIALAMEAAAKDSREIQESSSAPVNKISGEKGSGGRCFRCGSLEHMANVCPHKLKRCYRCNKVGHMKSACRNYKADNSKAEKNESQANCNQVDTVNETEEVEIDVLDAWPLYKLNAKLTAPVTVPLLLNGNETSMELDTGAAVTVMGVSHFNRIKNKADQLQDSKVRLRTYTGEIVKPLGEGFVEVNYQNQICNLPVTVVDGNAPTLMGRDWLGSLKLDWPSIFPEAKEVRQLESQKSEVEKLIKQFPTVFTEKLGCLKDFKVHIPIPTGTTPRFFKARPVSYALRERVDQELEKLQSQGIWEQVEYSRWATPIVTVKKDAADPSSDLRVCGDYKQTVNQVAPLDNYPIPTVDEHLASFKGCVTFSKIDLKQAYQQLELDDETKELLTVNTHRGLFKPSRLQFGVHSATGIFQREMDRRLKHLPRVKARVDDIAIGGLDEADHFNMLYQVCEVLKKAGLTVRWEKCQLFREEIEFCGHVLSAKGIRPMLSNLEAVKKAPVPTNVSELKAFLGMVNYYRNFIPNASTIMEPLHQLLRKEAKWEWSKAQEEAFRGLKEALCSATVLTHYDQNKPIIVHCDASPYGIGAVLSHRLSDGTEHPVAFCSRSLTKAERNYAHIEKEGLSLVFAIKKFHQYLYGLKFELVTDHKPLLGLFSETKALPSRAAERIMRWALLLAGYDYKLIYRPGNLHANADGLSRLPLDREKGEGSSQIRSINLLNVDVFPVTVDEVKVETRRDPELSKVLNRILKGWSDRDRKDPELKQFSGKEDELTTDYGCVLWGGRVVIPCSLRNKVIDLLHEVHPGMARMKALARGYVWWPNLDKQIEERVSNCGMCQANQRNPARAPIHPWERAVRPWQRIHIDHAGPIAGKTYLILVDTFSKWMDAARVASTSAAETMKMLRKNFATHGLPEILVSDNGSGFVSEEFKTFLKRNSIKHVTTAPYHPSSNGAVERYVQTFKNMLNKMNKGNLEEQLDRCLFQYRITPHPSTGVSPAEKLMKRQLRSALDAMHPRFVNKEKELTHGKLREFKVGDRVLTRGYGEDKWLMGAVMERLGNTNYIVEVGGMRLHRHVDQIIATTEPTETSIDVDIPPNPQENLVVETPREAILNQEDEPLGLEEEVVSVVPSSAPAEVPGRVEVEPLRRSTRIKKEPAYLKDYV